MAGQWLWLGEGSRDQYCREQSAGSQDRPDAWKEGPWAVVWFYLCD